MEANVAEEKEIPVKGNRFRRLQMKWELLSTKDLTVDTPEFDGPQSDAMRAKYDIKFTLRRFFFFFINICFVEELQNLVYHD